MTTGAKVTHAIATLAGPGSARQYSHGAIEGGITALGVYLMVSGSVWLWSRDPLARRIRGWSAVTFVAVLAAMIGGMWLIDVDNPRVPPDNSALQAVRVGLFFLGFIGVPTVAWQWFFSRRTRDAPAPSPESSGPKRLL